jgi:hypothetical protein
MTRRDYVLLSGAMKGAVEDAKKHGTHEVKVGVALAAHHLCEALEKANPRFDRWQFLRDMGANL